jgi:hypothetical protein
MLRMLCMTCAKSWTIQLHAKPPAPIIPCCRTQCKAFVGRCCREMPGGRRGMIAGGHNMVHLRRGHAVPPAPLRSVSLIGPGGTPGSRDPETATRTVWRNDERHRGLLPTRLIPRRAWQRHAGRCMLRAAGRHPEQSAGTQSKDAGASPAREQGEIRTGGARPDRKNLTCAQA